LEREKTSGLENLEKSGSESLEKNKWIRKFGKKQALAGRPNGGTEWAEFFLNTHG